MRPLEHMPLPAITMAGRALPHQMIENLLMIGVAVDSDQLLKRQRPSAGLHAGLGFFVPVVFEFAVGLGEAAGKG